MRYFDHLVLHRLALPPPPSTIFQHLFCILNNEFVLYFHDDALTELLDDDGDETTKGVDGANAMATGLATANMIDMVDVNFILMWVYLTGLDKDIV